MSHHLRASLLLIGLVLAGCNNQDNERLSRMGRAAAARVEAASGGEEGIANLRTRLDDANLSSRISARLRWDKGMEGAQVTVQAKGGDVELKGTVRDNVQRTRAVALANSTVGTESVNDALATPQPDPLGGTP
jgi:osmotically-inducible protein OsmY